MLSKKAPTALLLHSRFLEESSKAAANQQEELLWEENPCDLLRCGPGLTPQVHDGGSQEGDAEAKTEEHAPVGESLLQVLLQQWPDLPFHQLHVAAQKNSCSIYTAAWHSPNPSTAQTASR